MLRLFRRSARRGARLIQENLFIVILGGVVLVAFLLISMRKDGAISPQALEVTINAYSTQSNQYVPTIAAQLTETPVFAALTDAAPTLSLSGQLGVRQYAASAEASSERDPLKQGAAQAAGPPNTSECGDAETAWSSKYPNEEASLTLLYAELVTPTGLLVYENYNPGFITKITFTDLYGEVHTLYEGTPQLRPTCPFVLVVPIQNADYQGSRVTIYVDQRTSLGGWDQIDAVELIGIRH